jgi:hypothetical protein
VLARVEAVRARVEAVRARVEAVRARVEAHLELATSLARGPECRPLPSRAVRE